MLRRRHEKNCSPRDGLLSSSKASADARQHMKRRELYSIVFSLLLLALLAVCMEQLTVGDRSLHQQKEGDDTTVSTRPLLLSDDKLLTLFEQDTQTMDMIVNHCKENITWVPVWMKALGIHNVYIYDKCGEPPSFSEYHNIQVLQLPNTGREGASWIHHMLRKDIKFANKNIFLQGNHEVSLTQLQEALYDINSQTETVDFCDFSRHPQRMFFIRGCFTDDGLCARYFDPKPICDFHRVYASTGHDCKHAIPTVRGEFFVTSIDMLRYVSAHGDKLETLAEKLNKENNPVLGHYLERCWGEIFGGYGRVLLLDRNVNVWREKIYANFRRFFRFCADDVNMMQVPSCHVHGHA